MSREGAAAAPRSSSGQSRRRRSCSSTTRRSAGHDGPGEELGVAVLFGSDQYEPARPPASTTRPSSSARRADAGGVPQDAPGALRRVHSPQAAAVLRDAAGRIGVGLLARRGLRRHALARTGSRRPSATRSCTRTLSPLRRRGSQLLTTITNDAWYGHSSAPHQHFWMARSGPSNRAATRAVGQHGISGIVDPYGRVVVKTPIFEQTVAVGDVRTWTDARSTHGPATRSRTPASRSRSWHGGPAAAMTWGRLPLIVSVTGPVPFQKDSFGTRDRRSDRRTTTSPGAPRSCGGILRPEARARKCRSSRR